MIKTFLNEIDGINLIDIGSSGDLDKKWDPISPYLNLVGFDPNAAECKRMRELPHKFKTVKYLPYAIAGENTESILYKTKSIFCYSLLKPNTQWLNRFSFGELFKIEGQDLIHTAVLNDIEEVRNMNVDVLKTDTQGLELPILKKANKILNDCFLIETETGFVENYIGETTFSQISEFMYANQFLLFDINTSHRIPRNNIFKNTPTGAEQLMWCEAVWLKDYIRLAVDNKISEANFGRKKVLKALVLCALQGCIDYGYEVAELAYDLKYLSQSELKALRTASSWQIGNGKKDTKEQSYKVFNYVLRLLPARMRRQIRFEAEVALNQKHLFRN